MFQLIDNQKEQIDKLTLEMSVRSFSTLCCGSFRIIVLVCIVIIILGSYSWKDDGTVSCMLMLMLNSVIRAGLDKTHMSFVLFSGLGKEVAEGEGDHAGTP